MNVSEEDRDADAESVVQTRLRREIEAWRSEGLISDQTSRTLLARVESAEVEKRWFGLSRMSGILAIMGAVLVGLGVVGLVAVNWTEISSAAKLALMVTATLAAYAAGWFMIARNEFPRVGDALLLLGAILFGATMHLVAQSHNVSLNHPNLVTFWFLGVVPLAYATRSKAVFVLTVVLFFGALGFRAQDWFGPDGDFEIAFFPGLAMFMAAAAFLFAVGRFHARFESFRSFVRTCEAWSFTIAGTGAFVVSSIVLWRETFAGVSPADAAAFSLEFWLILAGFASVAVLGTPTLQRILPREAPDENRDRAELAGAFTMVGIAVLVVVFSLAAVTWAWLVFNLFLFAAVIAMVAAGISLNRGYLVNIAVILFGLAVLTRYFEIAFIFEIFDQALAYILAGVLLIAMAAGLERLRKHLLETMRNEAETR